MSIGGHHKQGRGEKIWLTPPELVAEIGPFDLDPCFSEPRPWVTASTHYGPDANGGLGGLHAPWFGRVFRNPPYGAQTGEWLDKCADHGDAIALVFARTETAFFFRQVWEKATGIVFLEGRLHFHHPDGTRAKANAGGPSALIAYGAEAWKRLAQSNVKGQRVDLKGGDA